MRTASTGTVARRVVIVGLLLLVGLGEGRTAPAPEDYELYYRGLFLEIAEGDCEAAIKIYRQLEEKLRGEGLIAGLALARMGACFEKIGKAQEAVQCYNRAIESSPGLAAILENASGGIVRLYPETPPGRDQETALSTFIRQGLMQSEKGEWGEAIESLEKAYGLNPDNPYLQVRLADCNREAGRFREAIYYYNLAVLSPRYGSDFSVYRSLSNCYRSLGKLEEASRLWATFLENDLASRPDKKSAGFELEMLYETIDRPPELDIPEALRNCLDAGEAQTRAKNYPEAAGTYLAGRAEFPQDYLLPARLAYLHEHFLGNPRTAFWYYKQALTKAPEAPAQRLRCRLALYHEKQGEQDKAAAVIKDYLSRDLRPVESDAEIRLWLQNWQSGRKPLKKPTPIPRPIDLDYLPPDPAIPAAD